MMPRDFLPADTPELQIAIVEAAHNDIGEHEDPPGSNRGAYVDAVNLEFGSPLGSYWCANAGGHWWKKAGATLPPDNVGSVARWMRFAQHAGLWVQAPAPGYAIIYGAPETGVPDHLTIVEQVVGARVLEIGGNTTLTAGFDRNGWIVQQKEANYKRILGYVRPVAAGSLT